MFLIPILKKSGHLEQIKMTIGIIGSRKLEGEDYGAQEWNIFAPNLTIYGFDADADSCKEMNEDLERKKIDWKEKHIPLALWNTPGKATLYMTQHPGSTSLYQPSNSYLKRYMGNSAYMELISTVEIDVTTLDIFCQSQGINEIDFLQIDVQGAELKVLEGASWLLEQSVLAIKTEVEFTRLYTNQPLFRDVDRFLNNQGFTLLDLCNKHYDHRRSVPIGTEARPGTLIWADAFYFRDLIQEDYNTNLKTPDQIFKLACIADALKFPDYAAELLEYLTLNYGNDQKYNFADQIIELLAQIPGQVEAGLGAWPVVARIRDYISRSTRQKYRL